MKKMKEKMSKVASFVEGAKDNKKLPDKAPKKEKYKK